MTTMLITLIPTNDSSSLTSDEDFRTGAGNLDLSVQIIGDYLIFVVSTPLSLFGCMANVVNLVVFLWQGRKDCVTICLFALGFSDFLCCFTVLVFSCLYTSNVLNSFTIIEPIALDVVLSYTAALFYDISQGITAFISLQRCLCVAMPLTFKNMFTLKRSVAIMLWFYAATALAYTPHFRTCGVYLRLEAARNITIPALWETRDRAESIFWLNYLLHIGVDTFYQLVVVISAAVMITGLHKSSKFHSHKSTMSTSYTASVHGSILESQKLPECLQLKNKNTSKSHPTSNKSIGKSRPTSTKNTSKSRPSSNKNRNVAKTIFALSLLAIVCNTERLSVVYGQRFVAGLTFDGEYHIIFFVSARVTFVFSMINASLNGLIYYFLNPSYRRTFQEIFCFRTQESPSTSK